VVTRCTRRDIGRVEIYASWNNEEERRKERERERKSMPGNIRFIL